MSHRVSVIIPAWNLWHLTRDCLQSLAQYTALDDIEVIVVDNGSTDDTATELAPLGEALFGAYFKAMRLPENRGFAKGCNAGAKAAGGDYLFFLNNDTLVTENWLPPLRDALARTPKMGMVGPLLLYPETREVQHCGVVITPIQELHHLYDSFPGGHALAHKRRVLQAITGAALYMTARVFWGCGGFHEGYINSFEDVDLCFSVRRLGLHIACIAESVILHRTSQTPGRFDHNAANAALLGQRCLESMVSDEHRFMAEDGYTPVLSPLLMLYAILPQDKEGALTQSFTRAFDAERCVARLEAEPLWQGGYALLTEHLEKAGQWAQACIVRRRQAHFFPLPHYYAALARCAARASDMEMAQKVGQQLETCNTPEWQTHTQRQAKHWRDAYAAISDTVLVQLFDDWLAKYGG